MKSMKYHDNTLKFFSNGWAFNHQASIVLYDEKPFSYIYGWHGTVMHQRGQEHPPNTTNNLGFQTRTS